MPRSMLFRQGFLEVPSCLTGPRVVVESGRLGTAIGRMKTTCASRRPWPVPAKLKQAPFAGAGRRSAFPLSLPGPASLRGAGSEYLGSIERGAAVEASLTGARQGWCKAADSALLVGGHDECRPRRCWPKCGLSGSEPSRSHGETAMVAVLKRKDNRHECQPRLRCIRRARSLR